EDRAVIGAGQGEAGRQDPQAQRHQGQKGQFLEIPFPGAVTLGDFHIVLELGGGAHSETFPAANSTTQNRTARTIGPQTAIWAIRLADLISSPLPASLIRWRAPFSRKENSTSVRPNQMNRPNGEPEKAATEAKASGPEATAATQP